MENSRFEIVKKVTEIRLEENRKQTIACLNLMDKVNKLLGIKPKENAPLYFEYHDRIKNEEE